MASLKRESILMQFWCKPFHIMIINYLCSFIERCAFVSWKVKSKLHILNIPEDWLWLLKRICIREHHLAQRLKEKNWWISKCYLFISSSLSEYKRKLEELGQGLSKDCLTYRYYKINCSKKSWHMAQISALSYIWSLQLIYLKNYLAQKLKIRMIIIILSSRKPLLLKRKISQVWIKKI